MKKIFLLVTLLTLIPCLLCSCITNMLILPDPDDLGEAKLFQKEGFQITLTDAFEEEKSQRGFDAYYVANFCGVCVLKEDFSLKEGFAEESIDEYIKGVIKNNKHIGVEPQTKDGLCFYEFSKDGRCIISYSYKGSNAFWIVQFICNQKDKDTLTDTFFLWAKSVKVA